VSPFNLHVNNIAGVNNSGLFVGQTTDIDGQTRPGTRPDAGADEVGTNCLHTSGIVYVRAAATGGNNGSSWANAYTDLNTALINTCQGAEIWVAAGSYRPTGVVNRNRSFVLPNGVGVYGGFAGSETARTQRNVTANVTILNGDFNNNSPGITTDDAYHVVVAFGTGAGTVLDGFTIRGGTANVVGGFRNFGGACIPTKPPC
jgi:hypothetical protein